jgi:hypothetical protein
VFSEPAEFDSTGISSSNSSNAECEIHLEKNPVQSLPISIHSPAAIPDDPFSLGFGGLGLGFHSHEHSNFRELHLLFRLLLYV